MLTIEQTLRFALQHHQAGRLAQAEQLYRQILTQQPNHADALHLLGVIFHQAGRNDIAANLIRRALAINPNWPEACSNLGNALKGQGQIDEAVAAYHRALALRPNSPEALSNLGNALKDKGQLDEAIAAYRQAITFKPDYAEAHSNLGSSLKDQGQLDKAIASYRQAIALKPNFPEAQIALGVALKDKRQFDEAIAACRQAIALRPNYAEAHGHLGNVLQAKGQPDEAIASYRRAIAVKPNYPEACNNLGNALKDQGQLDEAIAAYRQAIALKPGYPEAHNNLGAALWEKGQLDEAIAVCRQAIALKPDFPEAHGNLGNALKDKGQLDEAIAAFHRAIALDPNFVMAHGNLGVALKEKGQLDEATACYRRAIALDPNFAMAHRNLGNALMDEGQLEEAIAAYRRAIALKPNHPEAHSSLVYALHFHPDYDARAIRQEHVEWNRRHAEPLRAEQLSHANDRNPDRRLRIGYVSPDFRDHVVGRNLVPLFRERDRRQFEITCYAQVPRPDAITSQFQQHADCFRNIVGLSDRQVADLVRADRIDILVDLTLHMGGSRLLVFARKPAPVQVTFAGYPGSTGLSAIDYRLSDPYLDPFDRAQGRPIDSAQGGPIDGAQGRPPGKDESIYSERTIRLPDTFWCYDPQECGDIPVNSLPALETGIVTFGCLNNFCKVNQPVLRLWAQVLRQVERSRLMLLASQGSHRQRTLDFLQTEGVEPHRVEFALHQPRRQYLETYHRIDLGLDTFPYNGHTTSLDSLWMGVPVVTLVGQTPVSRAGWCQLSNLGLTELAGQSPEQFIRIAVDLAGDLPRLSHHRAELRPRMERSPLMDAPRFARNIESAYRQMWRTWCAAVG